MAEMWDISDALAENNRFKAFGKKHPLELAACFSNLDHIVALLNRHGNVGAFQVGFFRSEGESVYRIDQAGVKHAVETRLYVYVYTVGRTLYPAGWGGANQDGLTRKKRPGSGSLRTSV